MGNITYMPEFGTIEKGAMDSIQTSGGKNSKDEAQLRKFLLDMLPVAGSVAGGVAGSFVAPGVGTVGGAVAGGAGGEALRQRLAGEEFNPMGVVEEGAWGLAGAGLGKGLQIGTKVLGKTARGVGRKYAMSAIRPSPTQQRVFLEKTGKKMPDFIQEKGLYEKGSAQVDDLIKKGVDKYNTSAMDSSVRVPIKTVVKTFDEKIAKLRKTATSTAQAKAKNLEAEKTTFLKIHGKKADVGLDEITELKRAAGDATPEGMFFNKADLAQSTNKMTFDIYKTLLDGASGNTKLIGRELKELKAFQKIVSQQAGIGEGNLPAGLTQLLGMGAGGALGGGGIGYVGSGGDPKATLAGILVGMGFPALANNPRVIATLSKALTQGGNKLATSGNGLVSNTIGQTAAHGLMPDLVVGAGEEHQQTNNAGYNESGNEANNYNDPYQQDGIENHGGNDSTNSQMVQMRNKRTGEVKTVTREEADALKSGKGSTDMEQQLMEAIRNAPDKKTLDFYTAKLKALYPNAKGKTFSEGDKKFVLAKNEATKALQLLEGGNVRTGKKAAVESKFEEFMGTQDPNTTTFKAQIATARTAARNALLGANMSERELESYLDAIFSYSNEPAIIQAKLANFIQSMDDYETGIAGVAPDTMPNINVEETVNQYYTGE